MCIVWIQPHFAASLLLRFCLGLLLLVNDLLGGQRILLACLRRFQFLRVEVLDAADEVQLLLFGLDGYFGVVEILIRFGMLYLWAGDMLSVYQAR